MIESLIKYLYGLRNTEYKIRNTYMEYGIRNTEYGIRNTEYGIWNTEYEIRPELWRAKVLGQDIYIYIYQDYIQISY